MTNREIEQLAGEAGARLQEIQNALERKEVEAAKVRFPRGFIISAGTRRMRIRFVKSDSVRNNVAYTLMLYDVYLWILRRTDLGGTARDMLIKACLATLGAVAEALLNDWYTGKIGKRQRFASRTKRLVDDEVIDTNLKKDLDWLWDMRCRQHLYELGSEFQFYSIDDQRRAARAVANLVDQLSAAFE